MSKKFLTDIDLNKNEIQNAVFHKLSSSPSNPAEAQFYYNTNDTVLYLHDGTQWKPVGVSVNALSQNNAKVVTSATISSGTVTLGTTNIESLKLGGYSYDSSVTGNVAANDTLNTAFSKLTKSISASANVIESITVGSGSGMPTTNPDANKNVNIPLVTTTNHGAMSASDKTKINGIASGAEVNQNAFSYIQTESGSTNKAAAASKTDTLTIEGYEDPQTFDKFFEVTNSGKTIYIGPSSLGEIAFGNALKAVLKTTQSSFDSVYVNEVSSGGSSMVTKSYEIDKTSLVDSTVHIPSSHVVYDALSNIVIPTATGSVTGSATSFVKSVSIAKTNNQYVLSGTTQAADTTVSTSATGIPTTAAVAAFVNSSIQSLASNYVTYNAAGSRFPTHAALIAATTFYSGGAVYTPVKNDYCVIADDETQTHHSTRYQYDGTQWVYMYDLGSVFTAAQQAAIDSGITATKVGYYDTHIGDDTVHLHKITVGTGTTKQEKTVSNSELTIDIATTSKDGALSAADKTTINSLKTVATTGSYNDLTNKPTIPQGTVTSVRVQATAPVLSSQSSAQTGSLNTTISLDNAYGDTKNPYGSKSANTFLAAPDGSNGVPSFRSMAIGDIASLIQTYNIPVIFSMQNPALTPTGGICTWSITDLDYLDQTYVIPHSLPDLSTAVVVIKEFSTGEQVYADVEYSSSLLNISMNSASNIAAGTYECVITTRLIYDPTER